MFSGSSGQETSIPPQSTDNAVPGTSNADSGSRPHESDGAIPNPCLGAQIVVNGASSSTASNGRPMM